MTSMILQYIIMRKDLLPSKKSANSFSMGANVAQACHAATAAIFKTTQNQATVDYLSRPAHFAGLHVDQEQQQNVRPIADADVDAGRLGRNQCWQQCVLAAAGAGPVEDGIPRTRHPSAGSETRLVPAKTTDNGSMKLNQLEFRSGACLSCSADFQSAGSPACSRQPRVCMGAQSLATPADCKSALQPSATRRYGRIIYRHFEVRAQLRRSLART